MPRMFRVLVVSFCLMVLVPTLPSVAGAYTVQAGDTPTSIAKKHGISVQDLLKANKSLKPNQLKVGDSLTIPGSAEAKGASKHSSKEASQEKNSRKKSKEPEVKEQAPSKGKEHKTAAAKTSTHVVKKGETLGEIASKLGVSTADLLKANKGLDAKHLKVGQTLTVPGGAAPEKVAEPAEKTSRKSAKTSEREENTKSYTVHRHETVHSIARKFHISVEELTRLNPGLGKKVNTGKKLRVPAGEPASETPRSRRERTAEPEVEATPTAPTPIPEPTPTPAPAAPTATPEAAPAKPATAEPAAPTLPDSKASAEADSYFEKGIDFGKQNKFQKAVENFDKAIKLNPNRADFFASRGHAHYYLGKYDKAIDDYTKAIAKNPNYALAYSMRGLSRTRSGHYPQAIEDFNRAIALGPKEADYYKGRGFTYLHLKQPELMCQDYKKACDLGDCELLESARKEKACQ